MTDIEFRDPSPAAQIRAGRKGTFESRVLQLRSHPGRWAMVGECKTERAALGQVGRLKGKLGKEGYEIGRDGSEVFARYVGPDFYAEPRFS